MLAYNLLKVSQNGQGLVRRLAIPTQSLMLIARSGFQEQAQDDLQDRGVNWLKPLETSWSSLNHPPVTS